jgi:hypothetical protein
MQQGVPGQPSAALRLQPRDFQLLRGLFECRMMTLSHATALFFEDRYESASKRVQALKAAGYVRDRRRGIGQPSLLYLAKRAFDLLKAEGRLADYPHLTPEQFEKRSRIKESTLEHELAVMDVRVAFAKAFRAQTSFVLDHFTTWPRLNEFTAEHPVQQQRVILRPDGFLRIHGRETGFDDLTEDAFFFELDRSNEVQRVLAEKALCYRNFYTSGGYAQRCGGSPHDFKDFPFRVLIVLQNAERRNNLAERLMNVTPPIRVQAWLSTRDEVLREPLGRIWVCPLDYARATEGTAYAPELYRGHGNYVRRPERERLVEERIAKRTLFESV